MKDFQAVKELLTSAQSPLRARREFWPRTDYAAFDGDDIERYDADGHPSFLTEEDLAAKDWIVEVDPA
ncbi:MAG: hypothetical protein JST12_14810 [Armatimonadetes bacterium]|nr:hypothetical protein [Armatimonadota bacterium]